MAKIQVVRTCADCQHCNCSAYRPVGNRCYCELVPDKTLTEHPEPYIEDWCPLPDAPQ